MMTMKIENCEYNIHKIDNTVRVYYKPWVCGYSFEDCDRLNRFMCDLVKSGVVWSDATIARAKKIIRGGNRFSQSFGLYNHTDFLLKEP